MIAISANLLCSAINCSSRWISSWVFVAVSEVMAVFLREIKLLLASSTSLTDSRAVSSSVAAFFILSNRSLVASVSLSLSSISPIDDREASRGNWPYTICLGSRRS